MISINVSGPVTIHYTEPQAIALIQERLEFIMATQAETAAAIDTVTAKLNKIGGETQSLLAKITELTDALANAGNTDPLVQTAVDSLTAQAGVVDDLVTDLPSTPETPV